MYLRSFLLGAATFFLLIPFAVRAQSTSELEVSITAVSRGNEAAPSGAKTVTIRFDLINRSHSSLYVAMCCGKYAPLKVHNPAVEQLSTEGKWVYVGGAYQDLPAPIWKKLEPGSQTAQEVTITDPYRMLAVPGGFDLRPGYSLPINGLHRLKVHYSHTIPFDATTGARKAGTRIIDGYSNSFDIPAMHDAQGNSSAVPAKQPS